VRRIGIARASRRSTVGLIASVVLPVGSFLILEQALHSELTAFAIAAAIPVGWALATGLRRRRLDPIALLAAIVLASALAVSLASGGGVLPLKLRRAVVTGSLGLACLASVLVRRPLLPTVMSWAERRWPQSRRLTGSLGTGAAGQRASVLTAILGITLLGDAVAQVTLALTVSTTTFLGTSGLARLAVFTVGLGACALYVRRVARDSQVRREAHASSPVDTKRR
jgi:hypothetical protein